jgi:hypothetical protein
MKTQEITPLALARLVHEHVSSRWEPNRNAGFGVYWDVIDVALSSWGKREGAIHQAVLFASNAVRCAMADVLGIDPTYADISAWEHSDGRTRDQIVDLFTKVETRLTEGIYTWSDDYRLKWERKSV